MSDSIRRKKRILIFVVAYNAERTIQDVIRRIPSSLAEHETEILIIDDSSQDETFSLAEAYDHHKRVFPLNVLYNPVNQGYGSNQKLGFHYAIKEKFDIVALLHGDGQYAPEELPTLLEPLLKNEADAVFGSRMMSPGGALKGGMPLYKYIGNKILTKFQNRILRCSLSEFHSGYRLYSVNALAKIPFERNTCDFHFDTEIIIQLVRAGLRIRELPIPTYYADEICHINGLKYAFNVMKASILARAQDLGIFYERKYDVLAPSEANPLYQAKFAFDSPHKLALERVEPGSKVLDIGCASGYLSEALRSRGCAVTGIDCFPVPVSNLAHFEEFILHDLDQPFPVDSTRFEYVLLLDVIEHLRAPEGFLESLRYSRKSAGDTRVIVSTGNIGFIPIRIMLMAGIFNYGPRGILDLTHSRLFTFSSFKRLLHQAGYRIEETRGVPAPFPLAFGNTLLARLLLAANRFMIRISKKLFSYQIFMVVRPLPSLDRLMDSATEASRARKATMRLPVVQEKVAL
jgi:glycosyltransferase involved in cell wall biosynthesis